MAFRRLRGAIGFLIFSLNFSPLQNYHIKHGGRESSNSTQYKIVEILLKRSDEKEDVYSNHAHDNSMNIYG